MTTVAMTSWRDRLRPLSPLTAVLVIGLVAAIIIVPRMAMSMLDMAHDYGEEPGLLLRFAASMGWYLVGVVVGVLIVAKDWWCATERARVWANLACWLVIGLGLMLVSQAVFEPFQHISRELAGASSR